MSESLALAQSVDILTPIVDDPYMFGRIAAANSLADIYAVGARPYTALNILCYPRKLGMDIVAQILRGGADTVAEAGAVLLGGHSMEDDEPKYGLAVTGLVDPARMITSGGARPGDALILTKKIGTGILNKLIKSRKPPKGAPPARVHDEAAESMARLNKAAAEAMIEHGANACTDVTGFGLLGHAANMAGASGVRIVINYSAVPMFDGVETHATACSRGACERNREGVEKALTAAPGLDKNKLMVMLDPQTSGGLLISVPGEKAEALVKKLREGGDEVSTVIGRVEEGPPGTVEARP